MWYNHTMVYYSAIKINDFMKFIGKWMELENILSEVTQSQKNRHGKWILGKEWGIPTIQLTDHMKLKKKEDQSMDASVLLRRGNKLITGCRGWKELWRKRKKGRKKGWKKGKNQVGGRWRICTEG